MGNFKGALLALLYSQIEFLGNQINKKDLLIHTLIINAKDVYHFDSTRLSWKINITNLTVENGGTSYRTEHFETEKI